MDYFEWKSNHRIQEQDMNLIDKVVAEYRKSYSNDCAVIGAMAYAIGMYRCKKTEHEADEARFMDDKIILPEQQEISGCEPHDLLAAFRQLSIDMAVLFARKKVSNAIIGGQVVGMETYRLIFTGAELGNIWRKMGEIEKIINSYMKRG